MAKITSTMCGAVAGALLAGCSGAVSTQRVDTTMLDQPGEKVSGVVYYPPALFAEITTRTAYVNDGKLLGLATDSPPACAEVTTKKLVMLPDLTNPHTIQYKPGLFESAGTFGVSLRDGMLAAVNAAPSSERSQLLPALAPGGSPLAGVAGPTALLVGAPGQGYTMRPAAQGSLDLPPCTDAPSVVGYRRMETPPPGPAQNAGGAGRSSFFGPLFGR